ncbi:zincin-like metallopeptidase domain-containing protein [soil metagenome]
MRSTRKSRQGTVKLTPGTSAAASAARPGGVAPACASDGEGPDSPEGSGQGGEPERSRLSLYDEVTGRIVGELEAGRLPWVKPWGKFGTSGGTGPGLPRNATTGRTYSGVNILLLWGAVIEHGYSTQGWLTFRQATSAGGQVRRGERGTTVVFADKFTPKAEQERAAREGDAPGAVPFLKRFTVFNVDQCEGLEALAGRPAPLPERQIIPHVEALIGATLADFRIGGHEAYYAPALDYVRVPPQPAFHHQIDYYRTALHELSHWTGHPSRLNRDQTGRFGSKPYGFEELVAELSAAFACAALGVVPTVRHADYIGSWLSILKEDNRAIFRAASKASKAADYLLAFAPHASLGQTAGAARGEAGAQPARLGQSAELEGEVAA